MISLGGIPMHKCQNERQLTWEQARILALEKQVQALQDQLSSFRVYFWRHMHKEAGVTQTPAIVYEEPTIAV
jgi:hypothetical protein